MVLIFEAASGDDKLAGAELDALIVQLRHEGLASQIAKQVARMGHLARAGVSARHGRIGLIADHVQLARNLLHIGFWGAILTRRRMIADRRGRLSQARL